jgi:hypothetical protein
MLSELQTMEKKAASVFCRGRKKEKRREEEEESQPSSRKDFVYFSQSIIFTTR